MPCTAERPPTARHARAGPVAAKALGHRESLSHPAECTTLDAEIGFITDHHNVMNHDVMNLVTGSTTGMLTVVAE